MKNISFKRKQQRRRPLADATTKRSANIPRYYKSQDVNITTDNKRNKNAPSRKSKKLQISRLPTYFALVLIAGSLVYSSIINNNINVVMLPGSGLREASFYTDKASSLMSDSILNKSKFSFDAAAYRQNLEAAIPEIDSSKVSIPLVGSSLSVGLTFVKPAFIFRVNGIDYIVGDNGVLLAVKKDIDESKIANLKLIEDTAPLRVTVGSSVLLQSDIAFILTVINELERAGIIVKSALLPKGAGEVYISSDTLPYIIKFSFIGDARQQVGAYLAVKNTLGGNVPKDYVDARLGERIFVK